MLRTLAENQRPRVLMTADAVGGVWTYAMDLASGLQAEGAHVTVAVIGPAMRDWHRHDAARRGVRVVERPCRLEWMQGCWEDVDRSGEWLMQVAEGSAADIVHLNGYSHAALPWRRPVVAVAHSCVRTWWRGVHGDQVPPEWDHYTRRVSAGLAAADLVVAPTAALLDEIQREYGFTRSSRVIPNGSAAVVANDDRAAVIAKEDLILSAGRLWDEAKNVSALCAAASSVSWPVYLAGDVSGPSGTSTCSGAVRYLGPLAPDAMSAWYRRAAIYALPARYEPFGLSIVEAAAAGCALVLGDIRTLRENWSGAALFVPPDNHRALAGAINTLIADPELRRQMAAAAAARASRFTVGAMVHGYLSAYMGVLNSAAAA